MIEGLDHLQLAMPEGGEAAARDFYVRLLGLSEERKPEALAGRGGLWLSGPGLSLHLGVERPFRPARKAHPAFRVAALSRAKAEFAAAGVETRDDAPLPGIARFFVDDPFGNRIEILERADV